MLLAIRRAVVLLACFASLKAIPAAVPSTPSELRQLAARVQASLHAEPESLGANLSLAAIYLKLGEPARAVAPARKALSLAPGNPVAKLTLADAWLESGHSDAAYPLFQELAQVPAASDEIWFGLAKSALALARQAARRLESEPSARRRWTELRARHTETPLPSGSDRSPEAGIRRALFFEQAGMRALDRLLGSSTASPHRLALAASVFLWVEDYPHAVELLQQAVKQDGSTGQLWAQLGAAEWHNVEFTSARRSLARALELGWSDAETNYLMGDVVSRDGGARESLPYLRESVRLNPDLFPARAALARCYAQLDEHAAAVRELTAIPAAERTAPVWYQLARSYQKLGDGEQAARALAEYGRARSKTTASKED